MFIVQTKHHVNVRLDMDSCRILYGIAFTIKMSKKEDHQIDGYFDYVVPTLEGFWWQDGVSGIDYARKEDFKWISVIRLPDFCLLYTSPSPRDRTRSRMPSSA